MVSLSLLASLPLSPFPFSVYTLIVLFNAILKSTVQVDVDQNSDTAELEDVQAMPTFIFYKNGEKLYVLKGANETALRAKIKTYSS